MCNRYRMTANQAELAARYGVEVPYPPDLTILPPELFPERPAWVVRQSDGARVMDVISWGFPTQIRGASGKMLEKRVTNVRNFASPFWRSALNNPERRCLVPFTSFSEYGPGPKGAKPLFWFDVPSRPVTSFAGIWGPLSDGARAYAFLTTEPNSVVEPIHPKAMPVLLHEEDETRWLAGEIDDLVAPFPSQLMAVQRHQPPDGRDQLEQDQAGDEGRLKLKGGG